MAVAVAKAVEDGAEGDRLRVDRQHRRLGRRLRSARRADGRRPLPRRARSRPPSSAQSRAVGATVARGATAASTRRCACCLELAERGTLRARQLAQPAPDRRPEDGRVRDRRGARPRARRARAALRRRRQHASPTRRASHEDGAATAADLRPGGRARDDDGLRDPHRRAGARSTRSTRWSPTAASRSSPSTDEEITARVARAREPRGHLLRAVVGRRPRRARAASSSSPGSTVVCVLTGHGLKDTAASTSLRRRRRSSSQPTVESILGAGSAR